MKAQTYKGNPCKRGHDGVRYVKGGACVQCCIEKAKSRSRSASDLKRMKKISRVWYLKNKEQRAVSQKEKRLSDPAAYKEEQRRSYLRHREERLKQGREYYSLNKDKFFDKGRKRRALRAGATGTHTADDVRRIFFKQRGRCAACKEKLVRFHRDHVLPLVLGGDNTPGNIQLLCPPCNLQKHAKHPVEFMQEKGYLL